MPPIDATGTRLSIILASEQQFRKTGYQNTSMRMLADACGIAVGNLCYYYPKKEDLIMEDHNILMDSFMKHASESSKEVDPWTRYIGAEFDFILRISQDQEILNLYREVINVPLLRQAYYMKHHDLLQLYFTAKDFDLSEHDFYMSTVAFCSLCFQMIEQYDEHHPESLEALMLNVFRTRLLFLGFDPYKLDGKIKEGFELGWNEFKSHSNKELFYS